MHHPSPVGAFKKLTVKFLSQVVLGRAVRARAGESKCAKQTGFQNAHLLAYCFVDDDSYAHLAELEQELLEALETVSNSKSEMRIHETEEMYAESLCMEGMSNVEIGHGCSHLCIC